MSLRPKKRRTKSGKKVKTKKERVMVTAFHGTSSKIIKLMKETDSVRGMFDRNFEYTQIYGWRTSERHQARPVVVEVQITEKRFENTWLAQAQRALGKTPFTSTLRLKWADVVAVWYFDTKNNEWKRRRAKH